MKSEDVMEGAGQEDNNKSSSVQARFIRRLMVVVCVLSILFIVCMLGKLFPKNPEAPASEQNNTVIDSDASFKDCKILERNCLNKDDCNLYSLCGDGSYKICEIYDCVDTYGVFTQDYEGDVNMERKAKSVEERSVQKKKNACGGGIQIVEQKCEDGKMHVMVKLSPAGECKIGGFTLLYESIGSQPNRFTALKGNNYFITAETCGKITGIVPQTEEGIPIF